MSKYTPYLVGFIRCVFGGALILFAGDAAHDEFARGAERSPMLIVAMLAVVGLGALIVPGLNVAAEDGAKRGFRLFSLGRRAYDGKVAEIEIPPKADV